MRLLIVLATFAALGLYYWLCRYVVAAVANEYGIPAMVIGVLMFGFGCYQIALMIDDRNRNHVF